MRRVGHVARVGEMRNLYRILVGRTSVDWLIWLSLGTCSGLLWTRWWTIGFHEKRGISWPAEWLL